MCIPVHGKFAKINTYMEFCTSISAHKYIHNKYTERNTQRYSKNTSTPRWVDKKRGKNDLLWRGSGDKTETLVFPRGSGVGRRHMLASSAGRSRERRLEGMKKNILSLSRPFIHKNIHSNIYKHACTHTSTLTHRHNTQHSSPPHLAICCVSQRRESDVFSSLSPLLSTQTCALTHFKLP